MGKFVGYTDKGKTRIEIGDKGQLVYKDVSQSSGGGGGGGGSSSGGSQQTQQQTSQTKVPTLQEFISQKESQARMSLGPQARQQATNEYYSKYASSQAPSVSRGGSGGGGGTTATERSLSMSLPENLRNKSVEEVRGQQGRQSLARTPQMDTTQSMSRQAAYASQEYIPSSEITGRTTRTDLAPTFTSIYSDIPKPKQEKTNLKDVLSLGFTALSTPSGTMTTREANEILEPATFKIPFTNYRAGIPGYINIKGIELSKKARESSALLEYQKAKDIQTINVQAALSTTKPGVFSSSEIKTIKEPGLLGSIFGGKKTETSTTYSNVDFERLKIGLNKKLHKKKIKLGII